MNMHEHVTLVQRPDPILFYHVLFPFIHFSLTRLCAGHKKACNPTLSKLHITYMPRLGF